MVFDDAAARTTALTGVVSEGMISYLKDTNAVEVYDGSNWVSSDDPNAIQNTIVDAKGDLITPINTCNIHLQNVVTCGGGGK